MVIILRLPFHEPPAGQGRGPQPPGKCGVLLLKCHRGCDERDDIRVLGQRVVLTPHRSLVATAGNIIGEPVVEVSRVAPPRRKKPLTIWLIISGVWQARNLKLWRKNPRFENFPSRPRQPSTARDERVSNSRKPQWELPYRFASCPATQTRSGLLRETPYALRFLSGNRRG